MEMQLLTGDQIKQFEAALFRLLSDADDEFLPPLSARSSTTQSALLSGEKSVDGVSAYFTQMKQQHIFAATENDRLLGFVSFKENYTNDIIKSEHLPNIYLSTLVVSPAARGQGLTRRMYEKLFELFSDRAVLTRTWSTNNAHIRILDRFGFKTLCTLENDRGAGIDTVYFIKP